jgi:hypothetical protein
VEAVVDATAEIAVAEAAVVADGATGTKEQQSQENLTRSAREASVQAGTVQLARDADVFAFVTRLVAMFTLMPLPRPCRL